MSTEAELFKQQARIMEKLESRTDEMNKQMVTMSISLARIEERLKHIPDSKELENKVEKLSNRMVAIETRSKVTSAFTGSIAAIVVSIGLAVMKFFVGG